MPCGPTKQLHFARISCFLGTTLQSTRTQVSMVRLPPDLTTPCSASSFFRMLKPGGVNGKDSAGVCVMLTDPCIIALRWVVIKLYDNRLFKYENK